MDYVHVSMDPVKVPRGESSRVLARTVIRSSGWRAVCLHS